jgi:hypothetical protein
MARADFSERHYELAINIELVRESREYFVPSQPEEAGLGYDIALVPALPRVWRSLVEGMPGVEGKAGPAVPFAASLFVQYKVPEFLRYRSAQQAAARESAFGQHEHFYRFEIREAQAEVLLDLQDRFAGKASVCFAAGHFHERAYFYMLKSRSTVAENSVFLPVDDVRPGLLFEGGNPPRHYWTYDPAGTNGLLCSDARRAEGMPFRSLKQSLRERTTELRQPLEDHVVSLTEGLRGWRRESLETYRDEPHLEREMAWQLEYQAEAEIDRFAVSDEARATIEVQQALDAFGLGWFLAIPARRRDHEQAAPRLPRH